jgi:hypothetical protein
MMLTESAPRANRSAANDLMSSDEVGERPSNAFARRRPAKDLY